ncbi:hypothetical protein N7470_002480 [Penicillium chermesinum]|nr:hypothetical protein N7470_002480 [Penicillium chermesinum]
MLSMQNSPLLGHRVLNGSGLQDEGCAGNPSSSGINLRASTSSTSTGASPDDTSTESPDWPGADRSPDGKDYPNMMFDPSQFDPEIDIPPQGRGTGGGGFATYQGVGCGGRTPGKSGCSRRCSTETWSSTQAPAAVAGGSGQGHQGPVQDWLYNLSPPQEEVRRAQACKNAVVCEGYPPKEIWKSGRQKMADVVRTQSSLTAVPRSLPFLIDGIETEIDRRFLDHFVYGFSRVLTLINDDSNPFKEILLPMATQHRGLMHSLMCLSGSHLSGLDPEPQLKERKYYHFHRAIQDLKDNITASSSSASAAQGTEDEEQKLLVEDPIIASTIALSLNTICEGETNGEYRPHMDAARYLLVSQQPRNEKFRQFIVEFFQYHDVSNALTSLDRRPALLQSGMHLPDFVPGARAGMFVGVFDGLFNYISQITQLRDRIRERFNSGYEPAVDYQTLSEAVQVDTAIRNWKTSHEPETSNWCLAQLYRQTTWVYLYRTIRPSRPSDKIAQVVDDGLAYLDRLPEDAGAYSIVLMPLFLLGCSAFNTHQRERIQRGFDSLKAYSNLRNIEPAFKVVSRVWEVMDTKMEDSWDWEKIIHDMNMDFLIT